MDITVQDILKTLIGSGLLAAIILWWLNRPKQKKEIAALLSDTYSKMLDGLNEYIDQLDKRIERQEKMMKELEAENEIDKKTNQIVIEQLKKDNEECKYQHGVAELEMLQLKKHNVFKIWTRDMVYVMDDDHAALLEFKHKFAKISVLDYRGFSDAGEFLTKAKIEQPPIVVIHYRESHAETAEDVIEKIGYEPEIFIMSSEASFEKRFSGKKVRFFLKDNHYVYKIAQAIIKHLIDKK